MNNRTYRIILFMLNVSLAIFFLSEYALCVGQERVVFINERREPDGSYSYYGYYDIYIVNSDGTGLKKLVEDGINPVPSPDGKRVAFIPTRILEDQLGISLINTDGSGRKDFIRKSEKEEGSMYCCFHWSPDSRKIAFALSQREQGKRQESLWIVDVITGKSVKLKASIGNFPLISWSSNSKEMLLTIPSFTVSTPDFMIINIETLKETVLSTMKYSKDPIAILMPENDRLLYHNSSDESLWIVNRDGSDNRKLARVGKLPEISFQKPTIEVLPDKKIRFVAQEPAAGTTVSKLYELNIQKDILNIIGKTDSPGLFSRDGTMLLTSEESSKEQGKYQVKLIVKDIKNGKVYVLYGPWRIFREEILSLYQYANWVAMTSE